MEEQFYLVWPWLLWLGLRWARGRRGTRMRLAAATLLLASLSAIEMTMLYRPGYDPTRIYDGSDTRAFALLIGAALAFVWPSRHLRGGITRAARRILDGAGLTGLAVIVVLVCCTNDYSAFLYRGGMVLLSVATALVVGTAASPASRIGRALGWRPLRWLGVRSYGIYLWHYPIIVLTTPVGGRERVARGALQVAASIGVAELSWRYIEEPVRQGAIGRCLARARSAHWDLQAAGRRVWIPAAGAAVVCVLAGAGLTGAVPGPYAESQMQLWNSALIQACARYPDMGVYDWAADAQSSWFIADGIHYTSAGYAARAHLIAQALAAAFPANGHHVARRRGCLVS